MDYRNKATFIFFIRHDKNYMCFYEGAKIAEALTIDGVKKKVQDICQEQDLEYKYQNAFFYPKKTLKAHGKSNIIFMTKRLESKEAQGTATKHKHPPPPS